ncbi:MAG TPA: GNAT family N-acetyltransferase [Solirubrobacteraceae bacterium]|jgi:RimJ/RimL family protein N-acetyltransferase|nr:GNAT family N-acetyltransferase [Solirubrobacteraceae bacterium]
MKAPAPTELETPRMRGEPLGPEHEVDMADLTLDARVYRTLWPWSAPPTEADVRTSLADKRDHWERHGFGLWLLRDRSTGELVGRGGLQYTDAIGGYVVEAAWAIVPERWGQGLATELAQASVCVAFESLGLHEVIAIALPDNLASRRVMEKAAFAYDRVIEHVGLAHVLYRRRPDPEPDLGA